MLDITQAKSLSSPSDFQTRNTSRSSITHHPQILEPRHSVIMLFTPFEQFFPELAEEETRTFTILDNSKHSAGGGLPKDTYTLWESYCDEPDCDCRRVFFSVHSSKTNKLETLVKT